MECDRLRDDVLPNLGVRLEDKKEEATVIKLVDRCIFHFFKTENIILGSSLDKQTIDNS